MAMYDIVIAESTSPRDGRFIEKIGSYNPNTDPSTVVLKSERAVYWLMVGATPTDTARSVLSHEGIMYRKHLQVGVNKGAITQDQADEKYTTWNDDKQNRKATAADTKTQTKEQLRATRLEAEKKVNDDRAEAIVKKNRVEEPPVDTAVVEAAPVVEVAAPVDVVEEVPATASVIEAAPVAEIVDTPVVEAAPAEAVQEVPVTELTPAAEAAPVVETPVIEPAPVDEATPVPETPAPEATVAQTPEGETAAVQAIAETTSVAEETPAVEALATETAVVETAPVVEAPADSDETKTAAAVDTE